MKIMNLSFSIMAACLASAFASAALADETPKPSSEQLIYAACLPLETSRAKEQKEEEPEIYAQAYCRLVAGMCGDDPDKDSCRRDLGQYERDLNRRGKSLLFSAAHAGDRGIVAAMVHAGVDVDYPTGAAAETPFGAGWTPLLIAVAEGNEEVVSVLIEGGANVDAKNRLGRTPLMFASDYGFESIARMLLENGANVDETASDENGGTALIAASCKGHEAIVKLLLDFGADRDIRSNRGKTALMCAEEREISEVAGLLKTHPSN